MNYVVFQTLGGWVGLAGDEKGLAALTLPEKNEREALEKLNGEVKGQLVLDEGFFSVTKEEVIRYFQGEAVDLTTTRVNWELVSPFQGDVLKTACTIPYGQVRSYGWVAKVLNKPGASRAVGGALRRNPVPLIVPCHRVIQSNGLLGGFSGLMNNVQKEKLLALEGFLKME